MEKRRFLNLTVCVAVLIGWSAVGFAQSERRLSALEIQQRLSGQTAIGEWNGAPYRQYFDADGTTIFAVEGQRSARGGWRVATDPDRYESWWQNSGWEHWFVVEENGQLFWEHPDGARYGFDMVPGMALLFDAATK